MLGATDGCGRPRRPPAHRVRRGGRGPGGLGSAVSKVNLARQMRSLLVVKRRGQDVDVLVRQSSGDVGQQPIAVESLNLNGHQERALGVGRPLHRDQTFRLRACRFGRVAAVECGAPRCPDPRVTKPKMSSPGTGVQHFASLTSRSLAPITRIPQSIAPLLRRRRPVTTRSSLISSATRLVAALDGDQPDSPRTAAPTVAFADRGVQRRDICQLEESGHRGQVLEREQPLQRQAALAQLPRQQLLAGLDRLFATLRG